ncbi:hypothetical protein SNL152K_1123 [Streptomyces sp. NL15-2K]|nr:hypothetical protein SNL152K_1123 [Streptomyces sp. NL15-2K]
MVGVTMVALVGGLVVRGAGVVRAVVHDFHPHSRAQGGPSTEPVAMKIYP